jgi:hypothetical protein
VENGEAPGEERKRLHDLDRRHLTSTVQTGTSIQTLEHAAAPARVPGSQVITSTCTSLRRPPRVPVRVPLGSHSSRPTNPVGRLFNSEPRGVGRGARAYLRQDSRGFARRARGRGALRRRGRRTRRPGFGGVLGPDRALGSGEWAESGGPGLQSRPESARWFTGGAEGGAGYRLRAHAVRPPVAVAGDAPPRALWAAAQ